MPQMRVALADVDVASVAAGGTDSDPGAGKTVEVEDSDYVLVSAYATGGGAGASGEVTFDLYASADGVNWDTVPFESVVVAMSGEETVQASKCVRVSGASRIAWGKVSNGDGAVAATGLNVVLGRRF